MVLLALRRVARVHFYVIWVNIYVKVFCNSEPPAVAGFGVSAGNLASYIRVQRPPRGKSPDSWPPFGSLMSLLQATPKADVNNPPKVFHAHCHCSDWTKFYDAIHAYQCRQECYTDEFFDTDSYDLMLDGRWLRLRIDVNGKKTWCLKTAKTASYTVENTECRAVEYTPLRGEAAIFNRLGVKNTQELEQKYPFTVSYDCVKWKIDVNSGSISHEFVRFHQSDPFTSEKFYMLGLFERPFEANSLPPESFDISIRSKVLECLYRFNKHAWRALAKRDPSLELFVNTDFCYVTRDAISKMNLHFAQQVDMLSRLRPDHVTDDEYDWAQSQPSVSEVFVRIPDLPCRVRFALLFSRCVLYQTKVVELESRFDLKLQEGLQALETKYHNLLRETTFAGVAVLFRGLLDHARKKCGPFCLNSFWTP